MKNINIKNKKNIKTNDINDIEYVKLTRGILMENDGLFKTLQNLTAAPELSEDETIDIFDKISSQDTHIFVAILNSSIVGCISILIEQKFIHSGGLVGHIEDVSIRRGFEGRGISRKLINMAIDYANTRDCYKIILDCSFELERFYEKFAFKKKGIMMRL